MNSRLSTVTRSEIATDSMIERASLCLSSLYLRAPNFCARMIAKPPATPLANQRIILYREEVDPTAARAYLPRSLPTMIVSVIP